MTRLFQETSYFPLGRFFLSLLFPPAGGYDFATAWTGPSNFPSIEVGSVWMLLAICLFVCCLFVQGGEATAAQAQGGTCLLLFPDIYVNQVNQARSSASLESPHSWQRESDSLGHGNGPGEVVPWYSKVYSIAQLWR